jgi:hypothetical protein
VAAEATIQKSEKQREEDGRRKNGLCEPLIRERLHQREKLSRQRTHVAMLKESESQDLQRLSGRTKHGSKANEMVEEGRGTQQESSEEMRGNVHWCQKR